MAAEQEPPVAVMVPPLRVRLPHAAWSPLPMPAAEAEPVAVTGPLSMTMVPQSIS